MSADADDVLAFQRGPGRPPGYPRAPNSGRKPGQRNKRTLLGEDALRTLEPEAKRALRELLKSDDDGLRLKAASLVLAYCFGKPIESVRSENVNVSADVSDDKSLDRFELARRLSLIFTRGDPLAEAAEGARAGSAVALGAATTAGSAFYQNAPGYTRTPDNPPFNWHVRPDAGGFAVIHMGETKAQYPTEAEAIKAAWHLARGRPAPAEVVSEPEDDGEPKPPEPGDKITFPDSQGSGFAIACLPPSRPNLPNEFRLLDPRGQLVRVAPFDMLVTFLRDKLDGKLPRGEVRRINEDGFESSQPDQRPTAPPAPTVTRSYEHRKGFLKS